MEKTTFEHGKYLKTQNTLGKDTVEEMNAMDETALRQVVISANQSMKKCQDELDSNDKYQEVRTAKSLLESGKKEVDKRQKARIRYALHLLEEKGKVVPRHELN